MTTTGKCGRCQRRLPLREFRQGTGAGKLAPPILCLPFHRIVDRKDRRRQVQCPGAYLPPEDGSARTQ